MPDLRILKLQAQRQLKQSLEKANKFFNKEFTMPVMNFELRGQKAGVAYLQQNEIRLNPVLLVENGTTFIQQVVPHELAHYSFINNLGMCNRTAKSGNDDGTSAWRACRNLPSIQHRKRGKAVPV